MPPNPNSILDSVKKTLGFDPEFTAFDLDIVMYINATFGPLQQLGVGSETGFFIQDNTTLWSQYVADLLYLGMVKQYIFMAVRLAFDPPSTSFGINAIQDMLNQLAWRINVAVESLHAPTDPNAVEELIMVGSSSATVFVVKVVQLDYAPIVMPDAGAGNTFYLTLEGPCTINAPVNGTDGGHITLELVSNGQSVIWGNGWNFGAIGPPSLSPGGEIDIISSVYKELTSEWLSGYTLAF